MTEQPDSNAQSIDGETLAGRSAGSEAQLALPTDESGGLPEPAGWADPLTGAAGPRYWDRLIWGEQARWSRYRRGATIVLLDLVGWGDVATRIGWDATVQAFGRLARTFATQVRSSDHVARIGRNRFALLLVETDELQALNFIDRLLQHLTGAIDDEGHEIRVAVGWASPAPGDTLTAAIATAEDRLATDFFHTL